MDTGTPSADFENSAFWIKFTKVNDIIFMSADNPVFPFGELLFIGIWLSVHFTEEFKDNYG